MKCRAPPSPKPGGQSFAQRSQYRDEISRFFRTLTQALDCLSPLSNRAISRNKGLLERFFNRPPPREDSSQHLT